MQRKPFLFAVALLAVLLSILLVIASGSRVQAHNSIFIDTPTATPDPNQILNQADAVATQATGASTQADRTLTEADRTTAQAQNVLNVFNFFIAFLGVALTAATGVAGGLLGYGFSIANNFRKQLNDEREDVAKKRAAMDNALKAVVYLGLGDRLYNQDKKQEAIAIYRKVGSLLPEDTDINNSLGRIYSGAGYYDDAIKSFEVALAIDPTIAEAEMELGLAYRRRGEAQKGPGAEALRNADYDEALAHLKRAIELRPDYEDALAGLGAVYRRMGDIERDKQRDAKAREYYEQARKYYAQAQGANPLSSYALGNVASLSWYLGGKDAAIDYFILAEATAKVRIINADHSQELYWDYYDLALAQLITGTVNNNETTKNEAIKSYNTAIHLTPGAVQFDSVLNNLYLLQKAQEHIDGLDAVIAMLEAAKSK